MSDKTRWEGRDQQLGARIRIVWAPFRALAPAKKMIMRWNPSMGI